MSDEHLFSQFDVALNLISRKLLEMSGLVESQILLALELLSAFTASNFSDPWRNLWVVKVKGRHWTTTQEAGFAWS